MKNPFIKNLAVVSHPRFVLLFYQSLSEIIENSPDKDSNSLPPKSIAKMLKENLECENLLVKQDLGLTDDELHTLADKMAERLRSKEIAECFKEKIFEKDLTLAEILSNFTISYAEALLRKGAKVILNTAFGFKTNNIKNAIKERGKNTLNENYSSKLLVLDKEYFHYENSKTAYKSFTEYRKEFLISFFQNVHTYEDYLQENALNSIFKDFV